MQPRKLLNLYHDLSYVNIIQLTHCLYHIKVFSFVEFFLQFSLIISPTTQLPMHRFHQTCSSLYGDWSARSALVWNRPGVAAVVQEGEGVGGHSRTKHWPKGLRLPLKTQPSSD